MTARATENARTENAAPSKWGRRPCSDFMDMLRRLISCRIIIIIIIIKCKTGKRGTIMTGVEKARAENAASVCVWGGKCRTECYGTPKMQ